MKRFLTTLPLLVAILSLNAQVAYNTTLRDQLDYTQDLNDVWGYAAPDGTEYALVGTRTGLSIVSLADPDNISEVAFIAGDNAVWRDIKTYNNYAYVVADQGDDGLLIVDLSNLPGPVTHQYFNVPVNGNTLLKAHNIFIDITTGLAYLAGSNLNSGGMVILDIASVPGQASLDALAPAVYSHDVFVQDGRMYASEIYLGQLNIYDVSNTSSITSIGSSDTPSNFTHNAWSTADNNYVFTTDERANAPTAAYDITNPANPVKIDEFRPARSLGTGSIPHNVHVKDEYLIISHYTDGVEIVDASVPDNLVSIAYYDTWTGSDGGFNGCWGAYPFLPSGLVLGTDISNGLFVFDAIYQRAARIRGTVTEDQLGGNALNNVMIGITNPDGSTTTTNASGFYKTGFPGTGTYTITFSLAGYVDVTKTIDFVAGTSITLDTFMVQDISNQSAVSGNITSSADGMPIADAQVVLTGSDLAYTSNSDNNGVLNFGNIINDNYLASAGKWGFENEQRNIPINSPTNLSFQLDSGYLDGFIVNQGWRTESGSATTGLWVRAVPNGTDFNGTTANPGTDAEGNTDIGQTAYITGNGGGGAGNDDIDGGTVSLLSPPIDMSNFDDPSTLVFSYDYWFFRGGGSTPSEDNMTVSISNGTSEETIATYTANTSSWVNVDFSLNQLNIPLTGSLQLIVRAGDTGGGHIVEAGFDDFRIFADPALPVTFSHFELEKTTSKYAKLSWATANEINNAGFSIERSTNGQQFKTIGWVASQGNSNQEQLYHFIDDSPEAGRNYYRLKQQDIDGKVTYSQLKYLDFDHAVKELLLYPNPVKDKLYLNQEVTGFISLYASDGRLLLRQSIEAGQAIDVSHLKPGLYWLKTANQSSSFRKQ